MDGRSKICIPQIKPWLGSLNRVSPQLHRGLEWWSKSRSDCRDGPAQGCWQDRCPGVWNITQKDAAEMILDVAGQGMWRAKPPTKGVPHQAQQIEEFSWKCQHDIPELWRNLGFFTPLWHNWAPCPLCYLSFEWPIISGEKWGENSFFRRIRKCQGSLPTSGCYTPVIAFCYCKGFPRRDCLLSCASALRCIFTTRTDLAALFFSQVLW